MTYNQKKVDELVSNAKVLESLRELAFAVKDEECAVSTNLSDDEWYAKGWHDANSELIRHIDKRTVTLMERIYAELVYGEVPFEEE